MSLDYSPDEFRALLHKASDMVADLYEGLGDRKVFHGMSSADVRERFREPLPEQGMDPSELLDRVERDVFATSTLNIHPNFFAYIMSCGNQLGIMAELFTAALNQNCIKWHLASSGAELEQQVVRWMADFVGLPETTVGFLTSGGSMANLVCLTVARKNKTTFDVANDGLCGSQTLVYYTTPDAHFCHQKAVDLLGVGKDKLRGIPVKDDLRMDTEALEAAIVADKEAGLLPVCVTGNAGTTNTGTVDALDEIADICARHDVWFHVDAAYGGPAAALDSCKELFAGLDRADSVAMDPHKWLYVPIECGSAYITDGTLLYKTFSVHANLSAEYLKYDSLSGDRIDFMNVTPQLTRSFRALKLWMTFKGYGAKRIRAAVQGDIDNMRYLANKVEAADDFELLAPVPLSVVVFRYTSSKSDMRDKEEYLARLNTELIKAAEKDGRVFLAGTSINGKPALRACAVNHRINRAAVDMLIEVLREVGQQVEKKIEGEYRAHIALQQTIRALASDFDTPIVTNDHLDLSKIPEDQRVPFYSALFSLAAVDGQMDSEEVRLIFDILDLKGMSTEARRRVHACVIEPPPLEDVLDELKDADKTVRFGLMTYLLDVAWADGRMHPSEMTAVRVAQEKLGVSAQQLAAINFYIETSLKLRTKMGAGEMDHDGALAELKPAAESLQKHGVPLVALYFSGGELHYQLADRSEPAEIL